MVRLIMTPEIIDKVSWEKIGKLLNSTLAFGRVKILYTPTSDARTTAEELQEKIYRLTQEKGLTKEIVTYIRKEEFLLRGPDEIIKYLESEAKDEVQSYNTSQIKTPNIILILDSEMGKVLPNYIWKNMFKAEYAEYFGVPELQEGQGIFFNFKRNCSQDSSHIYSSYSCTALF